MYMFLIHKGESVICVGARLEWPLIAKLSPPLSPQTKKVEEEDVPWTGETLLQELASSMDVIESASS